jgi:hypothetical protein
VKMSAHTTARRRVPLMIDTPESKKRGGRVSA